MRVTVPKTATRNLAQAPSCRAGRARGATAPVLPGPPDAAGAACRDADLELFFDGQLVAFAKAICHRCPVREACLAYALPRVLDGVWGGTTGRERVALRRRLGITATPVAWYELVSGQLAR